VREARAVVVEAQAPRGAGVDPAGSASQTKRASGSMKRRISQAQASRSTQGRARVAQRLPWNLRGSRRAMPCGACATGSPREKRASSAWRSVSSSACACSAAAPG
jgi:hypothetical protein